MANKNAPILQNPQLSQADINQLNNFLQYVQKNMGTGGAGGTTAPAPVIIQAPSTASPSPSAGLSIQEVPFTGNTGYFSFSSSIPYILKLTGANTAATTLSLVSPTPLLFALNNQTTGGQIITVGMGTTTVALSPQNGVTWFYYDGSVNIVLMAPNSDSTFTPNKDLIPSGYAYEIRAGEQIIIAEQLQLDGTLILDGSLYIW